MRLAACLLLVVLATCPTGAPASIAAPWSQDEPGPEEESPLKRRDLPPEGVEQLFSFAAAYLTLPRCPSEPQASVITPDPIEVGSRAKLRFCGFVANQDVGVQVSQPNGMVVQRQVRVDAEGVAELDWYSLPGEPLGRYAVMARQGARQAEGAFTVRAASYPRLLVFPESGPPGTTFRIGLVGFAAGQRIPLHLYRDIGRGEYWYTATLAVVPMDARGQGTYTLRTEPDDPVDYYLVMTESFTGVAGSFTLRP